MRSTHCYHVTDELIHVLCVEVTLLNLKDIQFVITVCSDIHTEICVGGLFCFDIVPYRITVW
jgi:hypothetical protein